MNEWHNRQIRMTKSKVIRETRVRMMWRDISRAHKRRNYRNIFNLVVSL